MVSEDGRQFCPTLRPSKAEFSRPFSEYVQDVIRKQPDVAMFKVVPPKGWAPHKHDIPDLDQLRIDTPIKQYVFGTGGVFRTILEEQRGMTVADFKRMATTGSHKTPPKGHRQDDLLERAFWSSVTINPPLYGADTPISFFDEDMDWGWNLRNLGDLLCQYNVPSVPGVTSPMVYFGLWKSFFSWHVEDVDLYSINYLHFGAPKVWYCVSPKDRGKFEDMAKSLFPELHNICPAFLRHKDILLSPKNLRNHHINYVQAKQEPGEFIVLNAGAYHSGFNLGFNCAEAVNFATQDWLPTGRSATQCTCSALPDHVTLDMKLFSKGLRASSRLREAVEAKDDPGASGSDADSEPESSSDEDSDTKSGSSRSGSEEVDEEAVAPRAAKRAKLADVLLGKTKPKPRRAVSKQAPDRGRKARQPSGAASTKETGKRKLDTTRAPLPAPKRTSASRPEPGKSVEAVEVKPAKAGPRRAVAKLTAARGGGSRRLAGHKAPALEGSVASKRKRTDVTDLGSNKVARTQPGAQADAKDSGAVSRAVQWMKSLVSGQQNGRAAKGLPPSVRDVPLDEKLCAVVGEDENSGRKYFHLVQRLKRKPQHRDNVVVRWLREDTDGIYRPTGEVWEEAESALVQVRSQPWHLDKDRAPGHRLLTLRYRILDTDLVD